MPRQIGAQHEGVGTTVRSDLPALGEVGERGAVGVDPDQAVEDQRNEVGVGGARFGEQRIDLVGAANHAFDPVLIVAIFGGGGRKPREHDQREATSQEREVSAAEGEPRHVGGRLRLGGGDAPRGDGEEDRDHDDGQVVQRALQTSTAAIALISAAERGAETGALDLHQHQHDDQHRDQDLGERKEVTKFHVVFDVRVMAGRRQAGGR